IVRYTIFNDLNGLMDEVARDGYNRVFESIEKEKGPDGERYTESSQFDEFGFAHASQTHIFSKNGPLYTWSTLQSSIDDIIKTNRVRIHVHNAFLPNDWEVFKDYRGRVRETDKGNMVNGQFIKDKEIISTFNGIPGLID